MVAAYVASLLIVERLFVIVKPKLFHCLGSCLWDWFVFVTTRLGCFAGPETKNPGMKLGPADADAYIRRRQFSR
jgi:hypothetical protein